MPGSLHPSLCILTYNQNKYHEAVVDLTAGAVERNIRLGPNVHANGDGDEIVAIEKIALEDKGVQAEIAKLQLPRGTVVVIDPWIYGKSIPFFASMRVGGTCQAASFFFFFPRPPTSNLASY